MAGSRLGERLTRRQRQVLDLIAAGRTNFEIAQALGISLDGAKWHVREVLTRMGVDSREEAAAEWRSAGRPVARARGMVASVGHLGWLRIAAAGAAVVGLAAVVGALYVYTGDSPNKADDQTPVPTATPASGTDDLSPRSDIPIVDQVIKAIAAHDSAEVNRLLVARPERCTYQFDESTNDLPCPPAQSGPNGLLIDTKRGLDSGKAVRDGDLEILLRRIVPEIRFLHGAAVVQSDAFDGFFGPWKYEVYAYGGTSGWTVFLVDDQGIVGVVCDGGFSVSDRANAVPLDDWLIAPYSLPRFEADKSLYVLGRDTEIRVTASLPAACAGDPLALRLYAFPEPGEAGGIQVPDDAALAQTVRVIAGNAGPASLVYRLPSSGAPQTLRLGIEAPCLSQLAVQGDIELALLAAPADTTVAVFEIDGRALDQVAVRDGRSQSVAEFLQGELTASVSGYACETARLDALSRNNRGNVVFRVGTADQPAACNAPGQPVAFVWTGRGDGTERFDLSPEFVSGVVRLLWSLGPEPPHHEPHAPLIR